MKLGAECFQKQGKAFNRSSILVHWKMFYHFTTLLISVSPHWFATSIRGAFLQHSGRGSSWETLNHIRRKDIIHANLLGACETYLLDKLCANTSVAMIITIKNRMALAENFMLWQDIDTDVYMKTTWTSVDEGSMRTKTAAELGLWYRWCGRVAIKSAHKHFI